MWQLDAARGTGALAAWTGLDGTGRAHTACGCTSPDTQQATENTNTHTHTHTPHTLGTVNIHSHIVGVKQRPSIFKVSSFGNRFMLTLF